MTEKEKLKEIIETVLGFHDYYKVVLTEKDIDRLADKLIEKGYGNVKKWKETCAKIIERVEAKNSLINKLYHVLYIIEEKYKIKHEEIVEMLEEKVKNT